jgi:two-component system OmpR family response regulator
MVIADPRQITRTTGGSSRRIFMRILVVSNNPSDKHELVDYMDRQGFRTACMSRLGDVRRYLVRDEPNLVILDLAHDNPEHLRLLDEFKSHPHTPVIAIVERGPIEFDCATALERGADDCLMRPFGPREVVSRTRAILRRFPIKRAIRSPAQSGSYWFAGWRLKLGMRCLTNSTGISVALTAAQYTLLVVFLEAPRRTLTRQFLVQATHLHKDVAERSIDVQVMRLRQKLATDHKRDLIKTEPGIGYVFTAPVEKLGPRVADTGFIYEGHATQLSPS